MISSITTFNLAEKLAIVKDIDRLILADGKVAEGEMIYLGQLMKLLNFDSNFVEEARKFNFKQAHSILKNLSEPKKHSLAIILHEMAYADGEMDRKELKMLFTAFEKIGVKIEKPGNSLSIFDISDIYFKSSRQRIQHKNKGTVEIISENKRQRDSRGGEARPYGFRSRRPEDRGSAAPPPPWRFRGPGPGRFSRCARRVARCSRRERPRCSRARPRCPRGRGRPG